MKLIKKTSILIFVCCFGLFSCKKVRTGSTTKKVTTIALNAGYMGLFSDVNQQEVKPVSVTIDVDRLDDNYEADSNFSSHSYVINNDDYDGDNLRFYDVEVPASGSYVVSVASAGSECYNFCESSNLCEFPEGWPRFRGSKMMPNMESVPTIITVSMGDTGCL